MSPSTAEGDNWASTRAVMCMCECGFGEWVVQSLNVSWTVNFLEPSWAVVGRSVCGFAQCVSRGRFAGECVMCV